MQSLKDYPLNETQLGEGGGGDVADSLPDSLQVLTAARVN